MSTATERRPLYATISRTGMYFGVTYSAVKNSSMSLGSYDSGAHENLKGSGIPCIDYRTGNIGAAHRRFLGVREAAVMWDGSDEEYYPSLDEFLDRCREAGITVTTL